jgi:hypothetical protein
MTMMHCEGAPIPSAVAGAHTYKIADAKLTLYDEAGKVLVTLIPGTVPAAASATAPSS